MTSSVTTTEIRGTSGRRIAFCEYGDPTGRPVVVVHGSPGSRYEGLSLDNAAATAGLRLIVPDRPGFGRTDPHTDKGFHSWDDLLTRTGVRVLLGVGIGGFNECSVVGCGVGFCGGVARTSVAVVCF
jgi:pimeloyl-ACP methyl ester carboxylesterase